MRSQGGRRGMVLAALLFLTLGLLFVPECDDVYFVFWKYASWKDLLLTRPITEGARVVGVPANGRYLGNLLGVLQGKLYFTPLGFLRGVLMGGALYGSSLLLARRFRRGPVGRGEAMVMAVSLVLLLPRGIWQQVYSWGAGLVNYLLPMAGILLLADWLDRTEQPGRGKLAAMAALAFSCCLFMEPVTILMVLGSAALAGWSLLRDREKLGGAAALLVGSVLGALVMFSAPGYAQTGSGSRRIGLDLVHNNLRFIVTETMVRPLIPALLISGLLLFLLRKQGGSGWKLWCALLLPVHLACLADTLVDLPRDFGLYTEPHLLLGGALALLWLGMLAQWKGGAARVRVLLLAAALCAVNGPLLFVQPIGSRNFYPACVILLLVVAVLYGQARERGLSPLTWLRVPAAAAGTALVLIYACNAVVYHQRLDTAWELVDQGYEELTLPLLPFSGWAANEVPGKGDLSYVIYRHTPWDVALTFVPYGTERPTE